MSTRSQVCMKETGVYLYRHSDGYDLPNTVRVALQRKQRWDDAEYLTRIIFSEVIRGRLDDETGFGIGVKLHGDIQYLVTVDTDKQMIKVETGYDPDWKVLAEESFEDFICNTRKEW